MTIEEIKTALAMIIGTAIIIIPIWMTVQDMEKMSQNSKAK